MRYAKISLITLRNILKTTINNNVDHNCIIVQFHDLTSHRYELNKKYVLSFSVPLNDNDLIKWDEYVTNVIGIYHFDQIIDAVTVESLKIEKEFTNFQIDYLGSNINNYVLFKHIAIDIIEQLRKHLIEIYFDKNYPHIDIYDDNDKKKYADLIDELEISKLYEIYDSVHVQIPILLPNHDMVFYLDGTIKSSITEIAVYSDIILCFNEVDMKEIYDYDKNDFIYEYGNGLKIKQFDIVTKINIDE